MKINIFEKERLSAEEEVACWELWNREYPQKLNYASVNEFKCYLDTLENSNHFLLVGNEIEGWGLTFTRDCEIWFGIILSANMQGQSIGTRLLNELKKAEIKLNGWVVDNGNTKKSNGELYKSPLQFYLKNDFKINEERRIENERLSAVHVYWEPNRDKSVFIK